MFGYNPYYVGGAFIGGLVGIYLFSVLFRYAMLGRSGTKLQQMWVVFLTGIVAIGFTAFNEGTGGVGDRITNPPNIVQVVTYLLAALIVGSFVWWRTNNTPPPPETQKKDGIVWRAIALVFVIPMILIGIGNIGGSIYSLAVNGPTSGPGLGVSKAEMREIMLEGDMGPFWQVVNDHAPHDMDYIVERIFAREEQYRSKQDVRRALASEMIDYRVSLATYGPALSDRQRKEIIESNLDMLRPVKDQPTICVDLAVTGGQNLSNDQLLTVGNELNDHLIVMTKHLLDAEEAPTAGTRLPKPPTEKDYEALVIDLFTAGMPEDQLQAIFNQDTSHPQYCSALIRAMEGVVAMGGDAGEAVRFEFTQGMLTAAP